MLIGANKFDDRNSYEKHYLLDISVKNRNSKQINKTDISVIYTTDRNISSIYLF